MSDELPTARYLPPLLKRGESAQVRGLHHQRISSIWGIGTTVKTVLTELGLLPNANPVQEMRDAIDRSRANSKPR